MLLILLIGVLANIQNSICHDDISFGESLEKFCFPADTCKANLATACKCDDHCTLYGDCCSDSPYNRGYRRRNAFLCQKKDEYSSYGVYVKSVCPTENADEQIRENCEGISPPNDVELQVPVFSSHSSIIYKNYYCALCNDDKDDLVFWDVAFSCSRPSDEDEIMENLAYSNSDGTWGHWKLGAWVSCDISPQISPKISNYRECVSSISDCDPKWQDETVQNICSSYESRVVSKDGNTYKNLHCALCNNVDVEDLECEPMKPYFFQHEQPGHGYSGSPRGIPIINFGDFLDINLSKGNKIGKVKRCPRGQLYDSVLGRCVETLCIANRVPKGGKCVVP